MEKIIRVEESDHTKLKVMASQKGITIKKIISEILEQGVDQQ